MKRKLEQARNTTIVMASKAMLDKFGKIMESLGIKKRKTSSSMKQKRELGKKTKMGETKEQEEEGLKGLICTPLLQDLSKESSMASTPPKKKKKGHRSNRDISPTYFP